jgi:superfamily II DNA/RNA helicase
MMRDPVRIEISSPNERHAQITQSLFYADDGAHKRRLLDHILRDATVDQAIVFTATKRGADELADQLNEQGFSAQALHGDMNQRQRTRTLTAMQRGSLRVLVATDVASRGIDVQTISHAINFDLPMQAEDYVHRIGRTGRAGRAGNAVTLAEHRERHKVKRIEHFIGHTIDSEEIPGMEPRRQASSKPSGVRRGKPPARSAGAAPGGHAAKRSAKPYTEGHAKRSSDRPQRPTSHSRARPSARA